MDGLPEMQLGNLPLRTLISSWKISLRIVGAETVNMFIHALLSVVHALPHKP